MFHLSSIFFFRNVVCVCIFFYANGNVKEHFYRGQTFEMGKFFSSSWLHLTELSKLKRKEMIMKMLTVNLDVVQVQEYAKLLQTH